MAQDKLKKAVTWIAGDMTEDNPIEISQGYVGYYAMRQDYDLDEPIGWGKTKGEAKQDLLEIEAMEAE